jgi:hypothetical protein
MEEFLHAALVIFFFRLKNTKKCGEVSSPQVVNDVVIYGLRCCEENKNPGRLSINLPGSWFGLESLLEQIEFLCPSDGHPTVVHPKFVVNAFGVGPHGVQGHHEFTGNFRAVQVGSKLPKDFKFTFVQAGTENSIRPCKGDIGFGG